MHKILFLLLLLKPICNSLSIQNKNLYSTVVFKNKNKKETTRIKVEIANTPEKRAKGLMNRKELPTNQGMLFIYNKQNLRTFWMKNTYISLDIIFINAAHKIIKIHANTTPLSLFHYKSEKLAKYAIETNAGFCKQNKIIEGSTIKIKGL